MCVLLRSSFVFIVVTSMISIISVLIVFASFRICYYDPQYDCCHLYCVFYFVVCSYVFDCFDCYYYVHFNSLIVFRFRISVIASIIIVVIVMCCFRLFVCFMFRMLIMCLFFLIMCLIALCLLFVFLSCTFFVVC